MVTNSFRCGYGEARVYCKLSVSSILCCSHVFRLSAHLFVVFRCVVTAPPTEPDVKRIIAVIVVAIGCLLGAILIIPAFIDLGIFKSTYLPLIEEALHRRIDVSEVRLTFIPTPSIRLSNLKVSESPAFPDNIFFAAQQLQLRLKVWPLMRGRFEIREFVLDKPVINLVKKPDGSFNYADLADKKIPIAPKPGRKNKDTQKPQEIAALPFVLPARMRIKDGQLNIQTKGRPELAITAIELSLEELTADRPFPYRIAFNYPGLNTVGLEGMLRYQEENSTLTLDGSRLKIDQLVLPLDGTINRVTTAPSFNLRASSENVDSKVVFRVLSGLGLALRDTNFSGPMKLDLSVTGPSQAFVTQLRSRFDGVEVERKKSVRGTVNGELAINLPSGAGPVSHRLRGEGRLIARDGELTNMNLIKKVQSVTGLIGFSREQGKEVTTFKTLETDFVLDQGVAEFKRIHIINPQLDASGAGTMTLDRPRLNVAMDTRLAAASIGRSVTGKTAGFFKDADGRIVVPLKITGPVENPAVNLDTEKLLAKGMPLSKEKSFGSLFKQLFRR
jgi:hypothetical protein